MAEATAPSRRTDDSSWRSMSPPNNEGLMATAGSRATAAIVDALVEARRQLQSAAGRWVPLLVLVSPDPAAGRLPRNATACESGIDGIIATKTTLNRAKSRSFGALSGRG
jgi:dihydroorotate dehydrogenase